MNLLPSGASWPRHTNPEWRHTLRTARDHGWYLRPSNNHIFGTLQCRDAPHGQRCQQIIFTSGKGTDSVALSTRQKIDRCPHAIAESDEVASALPMTLGQIETLLKKAERLLCAARWCQREVSHRAKCEELLAAAEVDLDRCDELLDQAASADSSAMDAAATTTKRLAAAERSDPSPQAPALVSDAEKLIDAAEDALSSSTTGGCQPQRLRDRIILLRENVSQLRNFLRT